MLWGGVFSVYNIKHEIAPTQILTTKTAFAAVRTSVLQSGFGFAAFLGIYSWSQCEMEETRGVKDWKNALVGGMLAGTVAGLRPPTTPMNVVLTAVSTGLLTAFISFSRPDDH
jgi:hypothetical protein